MTDETDTERHTKTMTDIIDYNAQQTRIECLALAIKTVTLGTPSESVVIKAAAFEEYVLNGKSKKDDD